MVDFDERGVSLTLNYIVAAVEHLVEKSQIAEKDRESLLRYRFPPNFLIFFAFLNTVGNAT